MKKLLIVFAAIALVGCSAKPAVEPVEKTADPETPIPETAEPAVESEEPAAEERVIDIDHIPDSLTQFLKTYEVILVFSPEYDSSSPRSVNQYGALDDIAWTLMFAGENSLIPLSKETLSQEESETMYAKTGTDYSYKFDGQEC